MSAAHRMRRTSRSSGRVDPAAGHDQHDAVVAGGDVAPEPQRRERVGDLQATCDRSSRSGRRRVPDRSRSSSARGHGARRRRPPPGRGPRGARRGRGERTPPAGSGSRPRARAGGQRGRRPAVRALRAAGPAGQRAPRRRPRPTPGGCRPRSGAGCPGGCARSRRRGRGTARRRAEGQRYSATGATARVGTAAGSLTGGSPAVTRLRRLELLDDLGHLPRRPRSRWRPPPPVGAGGGDLTCDVSTVLSAETRVRVGRRLVQAELLETGPRTACSLRRPVSSWRAG